MNQQTSDGNSVGLTGLFGRPADDFPNQLCGPITPQALRCRWGLMLTLALICLIPRAWMAIRCDTLCADAVSYIAAANALEQGDLRPMLQTCSLNTYPPILVALRWTGFEWITVSKLWSIAMAVLTVFPLFGWVRRQFDDQVATFACVMYALHPMMAIISSWIIRDPTFWFLFNLSLYIIWRAVVEIRLPFFLMAGVTLTLAVHTRTEGWLLIVPLTLWTLWRLRTVPGNRRRLVIGTMSTLATMLLLIQLATSTIIDSKTYWQLKHAPTTRSTRVIGGFVQSLQADTQAIETKQIETGSKVPRNLSGWTLIRKLCNRFIKSFTYVYGLLVLIGLVAWRRVFFRFDQQTLFLENILLFVATVERGSGGLGGEHRYFATLMFLCMPYLALGLLTTAGRLSWLCQFCFRNQKQMRPVFTMLLLLVVAGSGTYRCLDFQNLRAKQIDLGRWILKEIGPDQRICGSIREMRLVGYYSKGTPYLSQSEYLAWPMLDAIEKYDPHVVLLWNDWQNAGGLASYKDILDRQSELGFQRVDQDILPKSCSEILVLVSKEKIEKLKR